MRALKRSKLHVAPEVSSGGRRDLDDHFDSPWAPVERLAELLDSLPVGLIRFWSDQPRGHVLIGLKDGGYVPGEQLVGGRVLDGVAHVAISDVATDSAQVLVQVSRIIDHLLGSHGIVSGATLSDGIGINEYWKDVGRRLQELFQLGYGRTEQGRQSASVYFSEGMADFCLDRRSLNVRDPQLERLLGRSLMSQEVWERHRGD